MEQLRVLIVDDEYLIRNLIRRRINWEEQGLSIVGEAANAHEALDMVDELLPDIIFTDICMPFIDGIEFSGMVVEKHPDIKIVIVTGHDEFEFARKSIKLGIADFILKPIRADELLSVVKRLKAKIYEERTRDKEFEKLKNQLKRDLPYLKENFLNQWVSGMLSKEEISEKARYFQLPVGAGQFQIAVIKISLPAASPTEEQSIVLTMECVDRAKVFFQDTPEVVVFSDTRKQIVVLSGCKCQNLVDDCELLKTNLINSYKCYVCIGIGQKHTGAQDVHLGYEEACRALNYMAFVGKNQIVCFVDVVSARGQQYHSNPETLEKLRLYISAGSPENALRILNDTFDIAFSGVSQFRLAAMDIIVQCQYAAMEQQIDGEENYKKMLAAILTLDNLPELEKALEDYVLSLARAIHCRNKAKEGNLISQVREYMEGNLSNADLGLASTAAVFFVSPGHLGRLMKKETGQTFVEYLTNLRMRKAKLLLRDTDLKGYQIGERVGIADPHYFSVLFKKSTGKSINEYRCVQR